VIGNGNDDESIDASSSIGVPDMRQEVSKAGGMSTERFHRLVRVIQVAFNKGKQERPQGRLAHHGYGGGGCFDQRERAGITSALAGWNPSTETQGSTPFCLRSQSGLDYCSYNVTPMMYVCCRTCRRSCLLDPIGSYRFPSSSGEDINNVREKKCPQPAEKMNNHSSISRSALTSNEACEVGGGLPGLPLQPSSWLLRLLLLLLLLNWLLSCL
jgi:hypothetical protein